MSLTMGGRLDVLTWFIEWTTQLNRTDPLAFAIVTVLTMSLTGVAIAVVAEFFLKKLSQHGGGAKDKSSSSPH